MLNVLDLFAGIGGFSLGLERTGGFRTVAFCEIDKKAQKVLNKHWPDVPVFDDVTALTKDQLDETVGVPVHVITGGFPCQDISLAGKGAGLEGERSGLWFQFHRLIKEIQPRYAIIENVSALRSRGLDAVISGLAEIGYDAEWHCIPASAVGAPHQRDRVWITAYRNTDDKGQPAFAVDDETPRLSGDGDVAYPQGGAERDVSQDFGSPGGEVDAPSHASSLGGRTHQPGDGAAVANTVRSRGAVGLPTSGHGEEGFPKIADHLGDRLGRWTGGDYWAVEPDVGRVAHGVPNRVDRLKQLGNAVVPQIPQLLGEAILDWENNNVPA